MDAYDLRGETGKGEEATGVPKGLLAVGVVHSGTDDCGRGGSSSEADGKVVEVGGLAKVGGTEADRHGGVDGCKSVPLKLAPSPFLWGEFWQFHLHQIP